MVSHAGRLIAALEEQPDCLHHLLTKAHDQTDVAGLRALDRPAWHWPSR
ncbi:hypothetical protein [Xanthomonas sp. NCPPB 1128]|nr:hypothetical protein [Xanthomonas sp. NCPPB 1128]